jgi:hypothetical protein
VVLFTDDWLAALDRAAGADPTLRAATAGIELVVNHRITGGPDGEVGYHVAFHRGEVRFGPGCDPAAQVSFGQDHATAVGLATGTLSAQHAFMTGRLRVAGDLGLLTRHAGALDQLADVFATVRAGTG